MPNYRQKNKKNKNKNRQKNQQQQQNQNQQQQNNKSKNQNPNQQEEPHQQQEQSTEQNRHTAGETKDNQSQGRPLRSEQSTSTKQQRATKSTKTPITTSPTPLHSKDEPPQAHTSTEEDALQKVDTTYNAAGVTAKIATATTNVKCRNLNSNVAPTTIHQQVSASAVQNEECNRLEYVNVNAQQTKLANKAEAADPNEAVRGEESEVISDAATPIKVSTMGNKDSKTFVTGSGDDDADTAVNASSTISEDRKGSAEPQVGVSKTQMAKVIVHRIVPVQDKEQDRNDISINDQVKIAGDKIGNEMTEDMSARKKDEASSRASHAKGVSAVKENKEKVKYEEKKKLGVKVVEGKQGSKVIIHKVKQADEEVVTTKEQLMKQAEESTTHAINAQQKQDMQVKKQAIEKTNQASQILENGKVIVRAIAHDVSEDQNVSTTQQSSTEPKVIMHHIQMESTSPPMHYEVELPDADSPTMQASKWSKQSILNKSIVHIQELSDESSSEYNDNTPLISEAESETESTAGACALDYNSQQIRTLSPDSEESYELVGKSPSSTQGQQDHKQRRAQKRVALESHFLPQLLSPRYLDSIVEENSDMSDTRSDCTENPLMHTHSADDLRDATAAKVRKANEIFPRSNLDFSRRHAKKPLGALPKRPNTCIREEPVAMVVAAKLIDDATAQAQECCTRLSSEQRPESEAAEVIYLSSSASSSLSDLLELDAVAEEGDVEDERDDSCRSIIDLDTDVREIITKPGGGGSCGHEEAVIVAATAAPPPESSDSRESTPVNLVTTSRQSENENENEAQKNYGNNNSFKPKEEMPIGTNIDAAVIAENNSVIGKHQHLESTIFENLKSLQMLATTNDERASLSSGYSAPPAAKKIQTSKASESETETELSSETTTTTTERCEYLRSSDSDGNNSSSSIISSIESKYSAIATLPSSDSSNVDPAVLLENIELEMNNVRDILNSHITDDAAAPTIKNDKGGKFNNARSSELKLFANYHDTSAAKKALSPSPPPIPPPPTCFSASDFQSDFIGSATKNAQTPAQALVRTQSLLQTESSAAPPPIPMRGPPHENYTFNSTTTNQTTEQASPHITSASNSFSSIKSALNSLSLLGRQESSESHCSDSTQHSYCTAVNVGPFTHNDNNLELTPPLTANSPISDEPQYNSWKYTSAIGAKGSKIPTNINTHARSALKELTHDDQKDAPIKKLRLLCTEQLASMPYGEQVLEELATVAQNISELQAKTPTVQDKINQVPQQKYAGSTMPYPLPQLPHISELQLSIAKHEPKTQLSTTPRGAPECAKILHTQTMPPVPTPSAHYIHEGGVGEAPWLGVPTSADPNVLVCLSPAQQQQLTSSNAPNQHRQTTSGQHTAQAQPDQLLDAHQKFLERRGYHELSAEQVKSLNAEMQNEEEQILKMAAYMKKLRKSLTPPPVPPPPVPSKSAETAAKARTAADISSIGSSAISSHSQSAYDATTANKYRNEQQRTVTFANGKVEEKYHQYNISEPADFAADSIAFSGAGSSLYHTTSSLENNSRQLSGAAGGSALDFVGKQLTNSADAHQYSTANASEATSSQASHSLYGGNNQEKISSFPSSIPRMQGVESELAKMFPSMGSSNIFDSERKRFSNIESSTSSTGTPYCVQLQSSLPKRYSNIEMHSWEAKKRMENGEVVFDYSDTLHERKSEGDKSLQSASTPSVLSHFPVREAPQETKNQYPIAGDGISHRSSGKNEIMSAIKLNTTDTDAKTNENKIKANEKSNGTNMTNFQYSGVPNHNHTESATTTNKNASSSSSHLTDHKFSKTTTEEKTMIREENIHKNSQEFGSAIRPSSSGGDANGNVGSNSAFEEFRQHAKVDAGNARGVYNVETPATAPPNVEGISKHSAFNFQHDKLFKDFDTLTQQLHNELAEGKAQREQREKSTSLYDLSRLQWNSKDHFEQLKKERHEHMKELEREIERSARSRQMKSWANGINGSGESSTAGATKTGRTFDIPIRIEPRTEEHLNTNGHAHANDDCTSAQQRAYNIPIQLENGSAPVRPPRSYDTVDDASRFRRAESMFNLSENTRHLQQQPQTSPAYGTYECSQSTAVDDWPRYASDFGSSENIARPLAREVEICYQRQRPRTIRAPRLSASTNDLSSSTQSYDTHNAYNVRRTHAPMMPSVSKQQHQQRPHHASCYSVLERDPNPTYISTTTRRGVSPAPVQPAAAQEPPFSPVLAPELQRRASLPREIQEQQLKYISSKEEELRMEFERLQNERRRLMEELNTTPTTLQMPQHPMRDIYRPVPKLPTLTEDEVFRQQMAEEWLNKVAEREERRLQKIIKISKVNEAQLGQHGSAPPHHKPDISDEFLKRVHERRTKLAMPADSDWESGAESQPAPPGHASESDAEGGVPVKVIEGKSEADLRQLPRHLREFARFSNHNEEKIEGGHRVIHQEEERRQEVNANSMSSALKKSSVVKTVKIAKHPEIVGEPSYRVPASVQQQQQRHNQQQQQQQGYRRMSSGGEQAITKRSHTVTTSTSNTRSSSERCIKVQRHSSGYGSSGGGGVLLIDESESDSVSYNKQQPKMSLNKSSGEHNFEEYSNCHSHKHNGDDHHLHQEHNRQQSTNKCNINRPPAPQMRSGKKTRFLLEPNRRSWSENDLLKEIDNELKLAKGFLYANGIWTPGTQTPNTSINNLNDIHPKVSTPTPPPPPHQPFWTPQPSPSSIRKEFRPVRFESPTLSRRYVQPQNNNNNNEGTPPVQPPWRQSTATTTDGDSSYAAPSPRSASSTNYCDSIPSESSLLNHVGAGPSRSVADKIKTFERSSSTSALYSPTARRRHDITQPFYKPNEVIFKVKHEYMSEPETEHERPRKMAQLSRRQVDGIGPVTNDGMPIILRSEVKEPHQHEWYKRLYQTIHKQKNGDDYVIRYKCQRARPTLKSTGYQSEPERNYDSDYSTVKYKTLDRRRLQSVSSATNVANRNHDDRFYGTMPNPIKSAQNTYKNQPGRIEDYVTGRSSLSEKERKEHLDQAKLSPHYTEGNLSRALAKDSGYTSDSNLVFRKREIPKASPLSPVEQKQAYKSVQAGGEPPLYGFRKPAPERPKDDGSNPPVPPQPSGYRAESPNRYLESDVNIHFKTPVRHEYKQAMSDEELAQRQAEQMQKLYQEERRRKYLQELQDMNARRHTDNFTPTQKSPIPLNRYDDFQSDLAPKSPNTITTRTAARALYNFQGQNARELSFKKGDIIYIRRQIDRNWYEGEHNAMIGLLPVSYVEIINKETSRQQPKKPSEGQARAKYNFQAQSGIELSLNKGELVTLTRRVDENWFEGKIANRKGIFPVSYVEVLTDIGAEDIAARTVISEHASVTNLRPSLDTLRTNINNEFNLITKNGHQPPNGILKETKHQHNNNKIDALHVDTHSEPLVYRALYKYRPQNSDEMELLEGDIVHVLEICDDGWFVGTSQRTGCFGTFPGNYVERVL
ncbi:uncharacterized protein CAP isoform X3 [Eurosta solidaginis]|uniref:uncharacterized protein CAP isoform X3 n=1 Tax=Eurosta solidaginis TaxID=178769 RepID=UPI003530A134